MRCTERRTTSAACERRANARNHVQNGRRTRMHQRAVRLQSQQRRYGGRQRAAPRDRGRLGYRREQRCPPGCQHSNLEPRGRNDRSAEWRCIEHDISAVARHLHQDSGNGRGRGPGSVAWSVTGGSDGHARFYRPNDAGSTSSRTRVRVATPLTGAAPHPSPTASTAIPSPNTTSAATKPATPRHSQRCQNTPPIVPATLNPM
jgi:hypothetical protein